jgi:phage terminase small subunit
VTRGSSPQPSPKLTPKQARFVELYLISLNATQSYRDAYGCSQDSAERAGPRLLGNVGVSRAIASAKAARSERTGITVDAVLARFWAIATADPRELIEYRRTCCRYCHSINHEYHRTKSELDRDRTTWEAGQKKSSKEEFNVAGGAGYNATKEPHPNCPECFGEGVERVFVHDTRKLSASALALYAGVKTTKDGIEVKMHDQHAALVNVGKHLGMFDEKPDAPEQADARAKRIREELDAMDATIETATATDVPVGANA